MAEVVLDPGGITVVAEETGLSNRRSWNTLDENYTSTVRTTMYCNNAGTASVTYFFNDKVHLSRVEIWNHNDPADTTSTHVTGVQMFVSADWGQTYITLTNPVTQTTVFAMTPPPHDETIQPDVFDMDIQATHMIIKASTSGRRGLSAVRFTGTRPDSMQSIAIQKVTNPSIHGFSGEVSTRPASNMLDGTPYSGVLDHFWYHGTTNNVWISFDLNGLRRLKHIHLWNYISGTINIAERGAKTIRILGSIDGVNFVPFATLPSAEFELKFNSNLADTIVFGAFGEGGGSAPVAYLKIECLDNHGSTAGIGLSEIQFFEAVLPPAGTLIRFR